MGLSFGPVIGDELDGLDAIAAHLARISARLSELEERQPRRLEEMSMEELTANLPPAQPWLTPGLYGDITNLEG
jgi:hypothetical protein